MFKILQFILIMALSCTTQVISVSHCEKDLEARKPTLSVSKFRGSTYLRATCQAKVGAGHQMTWMFRATRILRKWAVEVDGRLKGVMPYGFYYQNNDTEVSRDHRNCIVIKTNLAMSLFEAFGGDRIVLLGCLVDSKARASSIEGSEEFFSFVMIKKNGLVFQGPNGPFIAKKEDVWRVLFWTIPPTFLLALVACMVAMSVSKESRESAASMAISSSSQVSTPSSDSGDEWTSEKRVSADSGRASRVRWGDPIPRSSGDSGRRRTWRFSNGDPKTSGSQEMLAPVDIQPFRRFELFEFDGYCPGGACLWKEQELVDTSASKKKYSNPSSVDSKN